MLLLLAGLTAVDAVTTQGQLPGRGPGGGARRLPGRGRHAAGRRAVRARPAPTITVNVSGDRVTATVRAPVRALGARLPRLTVTATAVAAVEPGAPETDDRDGAEAGAGGDTGGP